MTHTLKMLADYNGITQADALPVLETIGAEVFDLEAGISSSEVTIGRILNTIHENGLAVAAYADITSEDAKVERDWSEDGRKTAVSRFVSEYLPTVNRRKVSDWRKMASGFDTLEDAGVETDAFAPSAFLALATDADAATFVETVKTVAGENAGKVTAKAFVEAGREAGIVPAARGSKDAKVTVSKADVPRQPVLVPAAAMVTAARDAVEAGVTFTKAQRRMLAAVAADLVTLAGDQAK